jgi:hypothetical protein
MPAPSFRVTPLGTQLLGVHTVPQGEPLQPDSGDPFTSGENAPDSWLADENILFGKDRVLGAQAPSALQAGPSFPNRDTVALAPCGSDGNADSDIQVQANFADAWEATEAGVFLRKRFSLPVITRSVKGKVRMETILLRWKTTLQLCQVMGPKEENRLGWLKEGCVNQFRVPVGKLNIIGM